MYELLSRLRVPLSRQLDAVLAVRRVKMTSEGIEHWCAGRWGDGVVCVWGGGWRVLPRLTATAPARPLLLLLLSVDDEEECEAEW